MKVLSFAILAAFLSTSVCAQVSDSLLQTLPDASPIEQVDILTELVYQYRNSDKAKADSFWTVASIRAQQLSYDLGLAKLSVAKGIMFNDAGAYREGVFELRQALPYFHSTRDSSSLEDVYNSLGISYKRLGQLDSSSYNYQEALKYVTDEYGRARLLLNIGSNYIAEGKLDSATKNNLAAVSVFERLEHQVGLTIANLNLGNIYYKQEDYDNAMRYYQISLRNAIAADHKPVQSRNYLNIGSILAEQNQYDSALTYFQKATALQEIMGDQTGLAASYRNLGELYLEIDNAEEAEKYFLKSAKLYEQSGHKEGIIRSNKFLANLYLKRGEFSRAINYIERSINLAREAGMVHELQRALELATKIYEGTGDYQKAYLLIAEEKMLGDSIFAQEKIKQINELQTKYETEKKDQQIESLSQQARIQELEITQRNTQLLVAGVIIVLLVFGGFYFVQQRKYKHQQAVSNMEQRMLRLQMNPHFIFNALTSIQNYILQSDTKESVRYLSKFAKLMRQILEHSREEVITIAEEVDMLTNYLEIQQLRFRNSFDFEIIVEESLESEEVKIPPLFAQPFVENALEHGLNGIDYRGHIAINFYKASDGINLSIKDNGIGIDHSVSTISEHQSLATTITNERLELMRARFKSTFSLEVANNTEGKGSIATLNIPSSI